MDMIMQRSEILDKAKELVNGDRAKEYGDAYVNHKRIADLWSVILEKEISVPQVYQCMIALKLSRLIHGESLDQWVDICGYASLGGENENS
tara:strand:- start:4168 stop:4440 length:273 start_codon:yes stop_codon:yes gene_type:complete